ncbi:hypothetical protein M758_8G074300 [Ceratodon purpureus]|nr:hypothetical protein M758_8G074300 [Ceratodon purpureus]
MVVVEVSARHGRESSHLVESDLAAMAMRSCVAVVLVALLVAGTASGQTQDCTQAYNYLTTCLSFVSGNDTTPSALCCSGINYLNTNNADCLCQIVKQFNSSVTPGVNATKAYELPSQCGIVVDTAKCPALALAPGAAVAPTPPSLSPPSGSPGAVTGPSSAPANSAAVAMRASPLTITFMALLGATLGATHLLWNGLTAT